MHTSTKVFAISALLIGGSTIIANSSLGIVGNNQGYAPDQPIDYSHRLHAGELQISCLYCHYGAERGRHAGIPSSSVCMNCHASVSDSFDSVLIEKERAKGAGEEPNRTVSPEIQKLYDYAGWSIDETGTMKAEPDSASPIPWVRIHQLPDFVYFDHSVHVSAGQACETCHGPVQSMERMRQEENLSMGWCIDCHRANKPTPTSSLFDTDHHRFVSTDCVTCHL